MATSTQLKQIRNAALGFLTFHAGQVVPTVALSPQTIYTVSGGPILIVSLMAKVSTVMSGTAYTLTVGLTPTEGAGSSAPAALASAGTFTSLEVGTMASLGATAGAALVTGANASTILLKQPPVFCSPGVITLTGSATQTGALKWYLNWIALDDASNVVAV
jgi:hypothetical protein